MDEPRTLPDTARNFTQGCRKDTVELRRSTRRPPRSRLAKRNVALLPLLHGIRIPAVAARLQGGGGGSLVPAQRCTGPQGKPG